MNKNTIDTEKSVLDIRKRKSIQVINFIIKDLNLENPNQFAELMEFKRPEKVYKVLRGENAISKKFAEEINFKFPQYKVDDLIEGNIDRLNLSENKQNLKKEFEFSKKPIPYYNVDFAGGWSSEEIFSQGSPDFYINNPEFDRSEFACNLVGNSISRRIPNGSIIGLKLIDDWQTYFPTNELYGVVMKNDLRTVKIVKRSKNKGFLILIPDPLPQYNQIQYEEEEVPIDFISKFYQITAWAQFERLAQ